MTRGKSVYPMIETDWKNALELGQQAGGWDSEAIRVQRTCFHPGA